MEKKTKTKKSNRKKCLHRISNCQRYPALLLFYFMRVPHTLLMGFFWSLSNSKSPQVSRTFLRILADPNNIVVWIVSARPPISNSSSSLSNLLGTVRSTPITIGITVTFKFYSFLMSLARSKYFSLFAFFDFYSVVHWDSKVHIIMVYWSLFFN